MRTASSERGHAILGLALGGLLVVTSAHASPPPDPGVTFVAHQVHEGLAIDRMAGTTPSRVTPPAWLRLPGQPTFVVKQGDDDGEALWLTAPAEVVVRKAAAADAPLDGRIEPSWDDEALRLTIRPAGGEPLRTDVFAREDSGAGPRELSRQAQLSSDVEGTYRAVLRRPDGSSAGWIRVRVTPHSRYARSYEAVFPVEIDQGLAAASAEALSSEIDWIQDNAIGTHRGAMYR